MGFDPNHVTTVTFDSYSTLVDVDAAEHALAEHVPDPESVSRLWRGRSLTYAITSNFLDAYQPFYEMNRDALQYALDVHDIDLTIEERDVILEVYHELDVFDDVVSGMEQLRELGYDLYVVSNGNPEMLASMVSHAGIDDLLEDTISADEVETYKPAVELYRHAAARTGTPIDEITHVSAGWIDVLGAKHAGMQGVWVNRKRRPWEPFDGTPDLTVDTFYEFVEAFEL